MSKIIVLSGEITGNATVRIGSNKSLIGKPDASLVGIGLRVLRQSNVIIRNIKITKVLASAGDALGIQESSKVWADHLDLSSDRDHDKDHYDGLVDVTRGSTFVSITNCYLHDHWKTSLVGHSDGNGEQDKVITVTFAMNRWENLHSRMPSVRFGKAHLFNN
jgi:pectate lyase